jgi:hypothetical protein
LSYTRYADHTCFILGAVAIGTWSDAMTWQGLALGAALAWLWDSAGRVRRGVA